MLTKKQEAFCLEYINASNASDAYRKAYSAGRMNAASVNRKAFDLAQNVKIRARIEDLRKSASAHAVMTLAGHLKRLEELSEMAVNAAQYSAAVKAEELRGKASGLYAEQLHISNPDGSLRPQVIRIIAKEATPRA